MGLAATGLVYRPHDPSFSSRRPSDFYLFWMAARGWLSGLSPYYTTLHSAWPVPLLYPMPVVLVAAPFAWTSWAVARAAFAGISGGVLAYAVTRRACWPLLICASGPFLAAISVGQWSPIFVAAAILPPLSALFAVKPTLGAIVWAYRPTAMAVVGSLVLLLVSIAIYPSWPGEWRVALHAARVYHAPLSRPGGWLLLLAVLRWRRPEARLLLAMACVPHTIVLNESLPLFLAVRTRREASIFVGLTLVAAYLELIRYWPPEPLDHYLARVWPAQLLLVYLPVLALTLLRENRAEWPPWLEVPTGNGRRGEKTGPSAG